ncbi:MAG: ABC transporter permease [Gemmatimonadota bacterium]
MRRDVRVRYKQAAMGFLWALFMPVVVVLSGLIVRLVMTQFGGAELDTSVIGGLAVKAVPWGFFVGGLSISTMSLVANRGLVTKVYFPREVLPVSALLAQGFDTTVATIGVIFMLPLIGGTLSVNLLWVPVLIVLLFCLVLALGLVFSCANVFFRDVRYIIQVLLTFGIFFTPVFFEPFMLGALGADLIMLNPVAPLLEGFRLTVIEGLPLTQTLTTEFQGDSIVMWRPAYLAYSAVWAIGGLAVASRWFRSGVTSFAEYA